NDNVQLDPSQVEDSRSSAGGGPPSLGSGSGFNVPIVVGGGSGGLLLVVLFVAFQLLGGSLGSSSGTGATTAQPVGSSASDSYQGREVPVGSAAQECQTG